MTAGASHIGAIVLAAGNSSRMGAAGPKQLLQYQGQSLLRRAVHTVESAALVPITVVLGAHANRIRAELAGLPVDIVENPRWESGMGSTLRAGLAVILERAPDLDAVLIMLCDQPLVSAKDIGDLVDAFRRTGKPLIAGAYYNTIGVPALIGKTYFDRVKELPDAAGAKLLFAGNPVDVATVPMPSAAIDIDGPDDFRKILPGERGAGGKNL